MRQHKRVLPWLFTVPRTLNFAKAGRWAAILGEPPTPAGALYVEGSSRSGATVRALSLSLTIAQSLAKVARFPLFEPPNILEIHAKAGSIWVARIELPIADEGSGQQWQALSGVSQHIVSWIAERPAMSADRLEHRRAFLDFVGEQLVTLPPPVGGKSAYHILQAAYCAGVPATHIGGTVYQLGWGAKARRVDRSITEKEGLIGARLTQNKVLTAQLLHQAGLPGAFHVCVTDIEAANHAARSIGWPAVIKPADAERGEGVTVDVQPQQLADAFAMALKASPARRVLVERQVAGVCHRLFIASGKLLYAVRRLPIGVYGNGRLSIAELITNQAALMASQPPWEHDHIPALDALSHAELARQSLTAAYVPPDGEFVSLRRIETTASGGVDEDVTHLAHPENIRVAELAARVAGLAVAGVDMISTDISKPWFENGAVINEVNYAPMLGEGLISRRHVRTYVERLMNGNGRIPVTVYVGGEEAFMEAQGRVKQWFADGLRSVVTSHDTTVTADGSVVAMPHTHLFDRVRALCLSPDTEALAIVVTNDALLDTGLPLEGVDTVNLCEPAVTSDAMRREHLLQLLESWRWQSEARCRG